MREESSRRALGRGNASAEALRVNKDLGCKEQMGNSKKGISGVQISSTHDNPDGAIEPADHDAHDPSPDSPSSQSAEPVF